MATIAITVTVGAVCMETRLSRTVVTQLFDDVSFDVVAGQFQPCDIFEVSGGRTIVRVPAYRPLRIRIASRDFVYTVAQEELQYAVVVLPRSESSMDVSLPAGIWTLRIVQGCGRFSPEHAQVIYLHALESS